MKKFFVAISLAIVSIASIPMQASAVDQKALVIIDSYFDSRVAAPNVTCVTLSGTTCQDVVTKIPTGLENTINHGNAMAEIAKLENLKLPLILLEAVSPSKTSVANVNAGNFIDALTWVSKNAEKVGAVSFSAYFNGTSVCSPASTNTAAYGGVAKADATIKALIKTLNGLGIKVFASTGNTKGTKIDYPACISDVNSVSVGSLNSNGTISSAYAFDTSTDYFVSGLLYKTTLFGNVLNTTSSATVAAATKYLSGRLDNKFVSVLS